MFKVPAHAVVNMFTVDTEDKDELVDLFDGVAPLTYDDNMIIDSLKNAQTSQSVTA